FLDDEIQGQERVFLSTHLMACDSCRDALNRCRDFYYDLDAMIPRQREARRLSEAVVALAKVARKGFQLKSPRGVFGSLRIFFRRWDARIAFAVFAFAAFRIFIA